MAHQDKFRTLTAPAVNELHKNHIFSLTKLVKTASEFCGKMASLKENYANQMLTHVEAYRKKAIEIGKWPEQKTQSFFTVFDKVLNEVEQEAKALGELASVLQNTVAAALFHEASRKKGLVKKVFGYRDFFQHSLQKSEDNLNKKHKDYCDSWQKYRVQEKDSIKDHRQAVYFNSHNTYVLQLAAVNSRAHYTYNTIVPEILDDLEVMIGDLAVSFSKYLGRYSEVQLDYQNKKVVDYLQNIGNIARTVEPSNDIQIFMQSIDDNLKYFQVEHKQFTPPRLTKENKETKEVHIKDQSKLKEELIINEFTEPVLKRNCAFIRRNICKLESSVGTLLEKTRKHSKTSDTLPPTATASMKKESEEVTIKNDTREKNCQLSCLKAETNLYSPAILDKLGPVSEEYADDLEELGDEEDNEGKKLRLLSLRPDREKAHKFVEHNFIKPAQCYYCKGIIVGLLKQGCRCQNCKMSVHKRCRGNVPFCTGSQMPKTASFDRESVDQDSSAGEYESIETYEEAPSPPIPRHKAPVLNRKPIASPDYASYLPPIPARTTSAVPHDTSKNAPKECVALFAFPGMENVDLSLRAGDRIKILDTPTPDWWEGQVGTRKGYFPTSYVQVIEPTDVILRCLYDFESEEGDEMCIEEGQIIILINDENNGWMVGKSGDCNGAFPSSYVEVLK